MRVAVAQTNPQLTASDRNLETCLERLEQAAKDGAQLLVLTECAISGYMFDSADEARPYAEEIPGPSTEVLERECRRLNMHVVCGLLERDGDALHNSAVLIGPDGLVGTYRKTHLPFLGVDRFVVPGDEFPVFETPLGRIGLEICYDLRFPEVTRALALKGADIVAHPTNFPLAARPQTEFITRARAAENRVYVLTSNRVGKERSAEFCGWSQIVEPHGARLAEAGADEEALLVADVDLERARDKNFVIPGEYEIYLFGHRRPDLYGTLVEETEWARSRTSYAN
ncbi:MAG TPA: carbon-nitrogen hydrolase family protein [Solirubrobacteraceae bacterium]|nr:carbon-nitrogen hydrolase family protein [Solirubrobacteraceae bacterium]